MSVTSLLNSIVQGSLGSTDLLLGVIQIAPPVIKMNVLLGVKSIDLFTQLLQITIIFLIALDHGKQFQCILVVAANLIDHVIMSRKISDRSSHENGTLFQSIDILNTALSEEGFVIGIPHILPVNDQLIVA